MRLGCFRSGKRKACVTTLAGRRLASILPSLEKAISVVADSFPEGALQTATVDQGDFSCYERLELAYDLAIYFADPYSSWQRGTNGTQMVFFGNSSPKEGTVPRSLWKSMLKHYISLTTVQENAWAGRRLTNHTWKALSY